MNCEIVAAPVKSTVGSDRVTKLKLAAGGLTDVGRKRDHNEDNILVSPDYGLFAVADGMGGHAAGEVASKMAISNLLDFVRKMEEDPFFAKDQTLQEGLSPGQNALCLAIAHANRELCQLSEENTSYFGMGTTMAAIYFGHDEAHIGHVGDSRVYRYRDGRLEALTQDHSWVNEQLQKHILTEEEARTHRWRNVITRALGNRADVEIDVKSVDVRQGDYFLLCSDGLTSMLDNAKIAARLESAGEDLDQLCQDLVAMANEAGGQDNVSVVVARVESQPASAEPTLPIELPADTASEATKP